jgi:hypothetical protein
MVSAQQRLDGQTEAYLSGSSNPQPLPAMFRIPKLTAAMKFALSKDSAEGFKLFFRSETSESRKQEQSVTFDIVAVPPPPESGITPAPYVPLMPRIELLIGGARRQWLLRVAADATARQALGIPPPEEAGRSPDKPFDLLVWQVVRADEEKETERTAEKHYVAGSAKTGAVELWLVPVPTAAASPVQLHTSPPIPAPFRDWLLTFLQGAGRRQVELLTPPTSQR